MRLHAPCLFVRLYQRVSAETGVASVSHIILTCALDSRLVQTPQTISQRRGSTCLYCKDVRFSDYSMGSFNSPLDGLNLARAKGAKKITGTPQRRTSQQTTEKRTPLMYFRAQNLSASILFVSSLFPAGRKTTQAGVG